jgi:hypothetical protein
MVTVLEEGGRFSTACTLSGTPPPPSPTLLLDHMPSLVARSIQCRNLPAGKTENQENPFGIAGLQAEILTENDPGALCNRAQYSIPLSQAFD